MIKRVKKLLASLYDRSLELNNRLFNLIMLAAVTASMVGLILSIFSGATGLGLVAIGLVTVLLAWLLDIANKRGAYNICAVCMTFLINVVLFPIIFFSSGGAASGMNDWLVLGIVAIFLLLSGKYLYCSLVVSIISFTLCYLFDYFYPEFGYNLSSRGVIYVDTYVSMIVVSLVTGFVIKFQKKIYEREREISRRQQEELEKANQTKDRFLANVSHEIRTPINAIVGLNEMNLRENISAEVEENSVNIQQASQMLLALVNDILDLSKIESGRMEIVPRQYQVDSMLSELVNINWIRAHEKQLEFRLDISPEIPSVLYGDDVRVKQVLTNILTNAIKYTPKGSVTLGIKSEVTGDRRIRLICAVTDTGIGIRKEDIPFVFDSFKRVDEKNNNAIEGTGLGLSISKQLVEMMNGSITVDSVYQRGSTFTVMIEQNVVDAAPIGNMRKLNKTSIPGRNKYHQSFEAPEARILVVDDNAMNRMVVTKLLRETKVQVDVAANGTECLEMAMKRYYNVIFMDHVMPEMSGIETLEQLRQQSHGLCRETPVVALTANAFSGAYELYKKSGFEGYLVKPVSGMMLENILLRLLPAELVEEISSSSSRQEEEQEKVQMIYRQERQRILITTESVCDIPAEFLNKYNISCISYYVQTADGRFADGKEISADNLMEYIDEGGREIRSMSPTVEEYETFFANALDKSRQVLHISMAANISNGYERAVQASRGFDNVCIIDCGHLSSGMGLIVIQAARLAREGVSLPEILHEVELLKKRVATSFVVASLDNLYHAGKISRKRKNFFETFSLHPTFEVKDSRIVCGAFYFGSKEDAYRKYIRRKLKGKRNIDTHLLFFTYTGCSSKVRQMVLEEVEKYQKFDRVIEQQASAVIGSASGLGAFGLLYLQKENER